MKRKVTIVLLTIVFIVALVVFLFSWRTVRPGYEGFVYNSDGTLDTVRSYHEGTYFLAPWNELILYDIKQKSRNWGFQYEDINSEAVTIWLNFNYVIEKGKAADLHLNLGPQYETFILEKAENVMKSVIEIYPRSYFNSENFKEIEEIINVAMRTHLKENNLSLLKVEITSVDLL